MISHCDARRVHHFKLFERVRMFGVIDVPDHIKNFESVDLVFKIGVKFLLETSGNHFFVVGDSVHHWIQIPTIVLHFAH